jgi:mono/diheme cytochrome c family protein
MKKKFRFFLFLTILVSLAGFFIALRAGQSGAAPPGDVAALLKSHCAVCHRGETPPKNLNLEPEKTMENLVDVPSEGVPSLKRINTSEPEKSYLLKKVRGDSDIAGKRMPPPGKTPLTPGEIQLLDNWVKGLKAQGTL